MEGLGAVSAVPGTAGWVGCSDMADTVAEVVCGQGGAMFRWDASEDPRDSQLAHTEASCFGWERPAYISSRPWLHHFWLPVPAFLNFHPGPHLAQLCEK